MHTYSNSISYLYLYKMIIIMYLAKLREIKNIILLSKVITSYFLILNILQNLFYFD